MKLDKSKKLVALILTSTVLFPNMALGRENRINTYIDEGKLIVYDYGNFELKIDMDRFDNLIDNGESVRFNIGGEDVILDSDTLIKLKEEALKGQNELNNYKMIIYTSFGVVTLLVVRSNIKKTIKKKL